MISARLPDNEAQRLEELYSYDVLDTKDEQEFDDLTRLASDICDTPIALISLIDPERQWFKSRMGLDKKETSRDIAFCAHTILQDDIFVVEDTRKDERFFDNPLVTNDPKIRFYAGVPLITPSGFAIGSLCIIDERPKKISEWQRNALKTLRDQVVSRLELKKKVRQLENANTFKSIFVSNVSHEIRTPLHGVMGLIDLLQETSLDSKQLHYTQAIKRSGESLMRIINDVLDLSKVESGKLVIEDTVFDIDQVVRDVVDCYTPLAEEKKLELRSEIESCNKAYRGDPHRLKQIFGNLISNAIKFTDRGRVVLRMKVLEESEQTLIRFSVIDTGIGLSDEQQKQLFKRFQQADKSLSSSFGGSGLGLSICKQLLQLMGGEIGIRSEVGKGSNFWFTLPLKAVEKEMSAPEMSEDDLHFEGRVLVAEDNRVNQIVAKGVLEKLGLKVEIAENGAVALTKLKDNFYNLVFLDCHMPVMSGYEAAKTIRSANTLVHNPSIPIIAMSANAMEGDIDRCLELGMNEFVSKPLDRAALIEVLSKYLKTAETQAKSAEVSENKDFFKTLDNYKVLNKDTLKALKMDKNHLSIVFRTFIETTPKEINQLSQAMIDNDAMLIRSIAHSIKGSSLMLGGEQLAALATFIEDNSDLGDELPNRKIIASLDGCFENFEEALQSIGI